jgi:GT2 family glycosyltransferase
MKLSVVIVNYNVKHFLELTLRTAQKALHGIEGEIIVVDNNSTDDSVAHIRHRFPDVKVIANEVNLGFSTANNQAIRQARGEYVLLLNPDTVVAEDTFATCIALADAQPDIGAIGVRMIDGQGLYLPESKRGLPTPWVSFCKIVGLNRVLPKSKTFNRYYLGHIGEYENADIEILSGAYMFFRKAALDKSGLLDEDFFMYGEDIDISYRILLAGYRNYYLADTEIIHFKGESTKRGSLNYVYHFYNAMGIFTRKHFSKGGSWLLNWLVWFGIVSRAAISVLSRLFNKIAMPAIDAVLVMATLLVFKDFWERYYKNDTDFYPDYFTWFFLPAYSLTWVVSVALLEKVSRQVSLKTLLQGVLLGTLIISGVTNFFDEIRFSKAVILFGSLSSLVVLFSTRLYIQWKRHKSLKLGDVASKKILIYCEPEKFTSIKIMLQAEPGIKVTGFVSDQPSNDRLYLGTAQEVKNTKGVFGIDEVVFDLGYLSVNQVFGYMQQPAWSGLKYRFFHPLSQTIIGSDSKVERGSFYSIDRPPALSMQYNRRIKRLADVVISLILLLLSPALVWLVEKPGNFILNIFVVLRGKKSWVGPKESLFEKYGIRHGIINPVEHRKFAESGSEPHLLKEHYYATDYKLWLDVNLLLKNIKELGN